METGKETAPSGSGQDIADGGRDLPRLEMALLEIRQREIETRGLLDAARAIMECHDFTSSARRIFDACREATGAVSGYVALLSDTGEENDVLFLESGGLPCDVDPNLPMPVRGLRAIAYHKARVVYENDFMNSHWVRFMPSGHVAMKNVMFAPLRVHGAVLGVIGLANKPGDFTADDARMADAFGDMAAIALRRARSEEALAASERSLRATLDSLSAHIALLDENGRILLVNKAWREFAEENGGTAAAVSEGTNYFAPCDNAAGPEAQMAADFAAGIRSVISGASESFNMEYPCNSPEQDRWFIGRVTPFAGEGARRVVASHEDLTERQRSEAERERLRDQLLQAQKMESVGRLAGGVAHDFNNMLNVIIGHAEMAMDDLPPGHPIHAGLNEIYKAAERSANLTRQLLAFARKQTIKPQALDLNETVAGMLKMLRRLIGEDIDLDWRPAADLCQVKMDPSQIDQIMANLAVNARDAIAGVGHLTIETANVALDEAYCSRRAGFKPGEFAMLAVSDDGRGMEKKVLSNIFEPFFTTKPDGAGTGLGLATIYGIVKQNNGFINIYSEPGAGTTVKIYIPRHLSDDSAPLSILPEGPGPEGSETVLLVEDEPAILNLVEMMLSRFGYRALAAGSPAEALRLAEAHDGPIHLLMTDVIMPEMNGRDLGDRLLAAYPKMKILFMSGYTANVIAHRGVLDESVNFIQKPFSSRALAARVRAALDEDA